MRDGMTYANVAGLHAAPPGATTWQDDQLAKAREFLADVRAERTAKGGKIGEGRINEIFDEHFPTPTNYRRAA